MYQYHRIKALLLLGSPLGDWEEVHSCYVKAECLWRITRRSHTKGTDKIIDDSLDELQEGLVNLKEALDGNEEGERDCDAAVLELIAQHDADDADGIAMTQIENEDYVAESSTTPHTVPHEDNLDTNQSGIP
jgi:hypothetical protein